MMPLLSETDLLHIFIERTPHVLPHVRVFRRNVINVEAKGGFRVRNGIRGQGDAYALVRGGRHVEIETKAARGVMADRQKAWRDFCEEFAIPHVVLRARPQEAAVVTVERWVNELSEVVNA